DIASLGASADLAQLVGGQLLTPNWANNPLHGMVADSVIAFVVRPGNPKAIHTWADLAKPGVQVDVPLPFTSAAGRWAVVAPSGRWAVVAASGAQLEMHRSATQARAFVKALYQNVVFQPSSERDALNAFAAGKGDVLLTLESEAIGAEQRGLPVQYVLPGNDV